MAMTTHDNKRIPLSSPLSDDLVKLNVGKAREVAVWLDSMSVAIRPADRSAICADLSDLYVSVARYQQLIDDLLAADVADRPSMAEQISEVASELRHLDGHARDAVRRLDRLAERLDPDEA
jgi:hypothetical protein